MNVGTDESVYFNGIHSSDLDDYVDHYSKPGGIGFAFQRVFTHQQVKISGAEVCSPFTCTADDGTVYSGGDSWENDDGRTCTCKETGISCACGDDSVTCDGGLEKWVDPDTCEVKCIRCKLNTAFFSVSCYMVATGYLKRRLNKPADALDLDF